MKDYLVKAIDKTKNLRLITVDAKDLVSEAQKRHDTWSASSAVLGRTLIGGLLLSAALLKDKDELCNYLIDRFYNDGYHGIQERRVIWDISVIAYMINKEWFTSEYISCPNIKKNTSYELTTNNHKITMVNYIDVNKVYNDLFKKLGE